MRVEERRITAKRWLRAIQGRTSKRSVRVVVVLLCQQPECDQSIQQSSEPALGRAQACGERCGAEVLIRQHGEEVQAQGSEQDFTLPVRTGLAKPLLTPRQPFFR